VLLHTFFFLIRSTCIFWCITTILSLIMCSYTPSFFITINMYFLMHHKTILSLIMCSYTPSFYYNQHVFFDASQQYFHSSCAPVHLLFFNTINMYFLMHHNNTFTHHVLVYTFFFLIRSTCIFWITSQQYFHSSRARIHLFF